MILVEPELHLDGQIVVPDLAGWRRDRMSVLEDVAYFTLAPDWDCEVISRSTEKFDRADKLRVYAEAGVRYAWLVHPIRRTLEAMRLHEGKWLTLAVHKDDQVARVEPFDAIELELAVLWADLAPPTRASEAGLEYGTADW
jgi:Uma2 family endonuclease